MKATKIAKSQRTDLLIQHLVNPTTNTIDTPFAPKAPNSKGHNVKFCDSVADRDIKKYKLDKELHKIDQEKERGLRTEEQALDAVLVPLCARAYEDMRRGLFDFYFGFDEFVGELVTRYVLKTNRVDYHVRANKAKFEEYKRNKRLILERARLLLEEVFSVHISMLDMQLQYSFVLSSGMWRLMHDQLNDGSLLIEKANSNQETHNYMHYPPDVDVHETTLRCIERMRAQMLGRSQPQVFPVMDADVCVDSKTDMHLVAPRESGMLYDWDMRWMRSQVQLTVLPALVASDQRPDAKDTLSVFERLAQNAYTAADGRRHAALKKLLLPQRVVGLYEAASTLMHVAWLVDEYIERVLPPAALDDRDSANTIVRILEVEWYAWYYAAVSLMLAGDYITSLFCYKKAERGFRRHCARRKPLYICFLTEYLKACAFSCMHVDQGFAVLLDYKAVVDAPTDLQKRFADSIEAQLHKNRVVYADYLDGEFKQYSQTFETRGYAIHQPDVALLRDGKWTRYKQ